MMADPTVHLTRWGDEGPVVIMVHGSAQGSQVGGDRHFAGQARLAQRGWRIIAPDRPGHARSPAPGRPDDAEADGEWVANLLGDGAHLVGHSFGGAVALAAAARRPQAVRSLTLIEPAMHALGVADPRVQAFLGRLIELQTSPGSAADLALGFSELVGIPADIGGGKSQAELERMGQGMRAMKPPNAGDLRAELASTRAANIPLLVVTGGWSPAFEAVGDIVADLGGGSHVVVEAPHHFPHLVSDEFNDLLHAFMKRTPAPSPGPRG